VSVRGRAAVQARFQKLLQRISFTTAERLRSKTHREGVTRRLRTSFATNRILLIGSAARSSAIPQTSDMDLMVVLRVQEARWGDKLMSSSTVLKSVSDQLQSRYRMTAIGKDGQAIVIDFGDGERPVEVVPAVFRGFRNNGPLYLVPNGQGDWMATSPELHNRYIARADAQSGGKLKNVAKMIKYWRTCRVSEIPLSSFHVELLMAGTGICSGVKTYGHCLFELFRQLSSREIKALQDPLGISGLISAVRTNVQRERTLAVVNDSLAHAAKALLPEEAYKPDEAIHQWNSVFNGCFPKSL
jgi:predicted nucleotidyltransferase